MENGKAVWLIERGQLCLGFGRGRGKLAEKGFIWVTFTSPEALRYPTRENAEEAIRKNKLEDVTVAEHLFVTHSRRANDQRR